MKSKLRRLARVGRLFLMVLFIAEPVSAMLVALTIASIMTSFVGIMQTIQSGNTQAKIARANAERQRQQALREEAAAKRRADIAKVRRSRERSAARVAFAASGVDVGEGTPLIVEAEDDYRSEINQQTIIATGFEIAHNTRSAAAIEVARGNAARSQAFGSALNQGASLLGNVATAKQQGIF